MASSVHRLGERVRRGGDGSRRAEGLCDSRQHRLTRRRRSLRGRHGRRRRGRDHGGAARTSSGPALGSARGRSEGACWGRHPPGAARTGRPSPEEVPGEPRWGRSPDAAQRGLGPRAQRSGASATGGAPGVPIHASGRAAQALRRGAARSGGGRAPPPQCRCRPCARPSGGPRPGRAETRRLPPASPPAPMAVPAAPAAASSPSSRVPRRLRSRAYSPRGAVPGAAPVAPRRPFRPGFATSPP